MLRLTPCYRLLPWAGRSVAVLLLLTIAGTAFAASEVFSTQDYSAFLAKQAELDAQGIDYDTEIKLGAHPSEPYTYIVRWETEPPDPTRYVLSVTEVGAGSVSISPPGGSFDENTDVTLTATPDAHWEFDGWSGDASSAAEAITITMSRDVSLTATFLSIEERAQANLDAAHEAYDAFADDLPGDFLDEVSELAEILGSAGDDSGGDGDLPDLSTSTEGGSRPVAVELDVVADESVLAEEDVGASEAVLVEISDVLADANGAELVSDADGELALVDSHGEVTRVTEVEAVVSAAGSAATTTAQTIEDSAEASRNDAIAQADATAAADKTEEESAAETLEAEEESFSTTGGDPVRLATGEFVTSDTELTVRRTYLSSRRSVGAFGPAWATSLDMRVHMGVRVDHLRLKTDGEQALFAAQTDLEDAVDAQAGATRDAADALAGAEAFASLVAEAVVAHKTAITSLELLVAEDGLVALGRLKVEAAESHVSTARVAVSNAQAHLAAIEEALPEVRNALLYANDAAADSKDAATQVLSAANAAFLQALEVGNSELADEARAVRDDVQDYLDAFDQVGSLQRGHAERLETLAAALPDQRHEVEQLDGAVATIETNARDRLTSYEDLVDDRNADGIPARIVLLAAERTTLEALFHTAADLVTVAEGAQVDVAALGAVIAELRNTRDELFAAANFAKQTHEYSTSFSSTRPTGIGTMTVIGESGIPVLFDIDDEPDFTGTSTLEGGARNYYPSGAVAVPRIAGTDRLYIDPDGGYRLVQKDGRTIRFDTHGRLISVEEVNGPGRWYGYESGKIAWMEDHLGRRTRFGWSGDRIVSAVGPTGAEVTYGYDAQRRLASVTDEAGDTVRYGYEDVRLVTIEKPDGTARRYVYEPASGADPHTDGDSAGRWVVTSTTDEAGHTEHFAYDFAARETTYTNPSGVVTVHHYNDQNRETAIVFADGSRVRREYDERGNMILYRDQTGAVSRMYYDGNDNLIERVDPAGYAEQWSYDANGRVLSYRDKLRNQRLFFYDSFGNLIRYTDPSGAVTRYGYDEFGRVRWMLGPRGYRTDYEYDGPFDSPTRILYPAVGGPRAEARFSYDRAGRVLSHVDEAGIVTAYTYSPDGRLSSVTRAGVLLETRSYNNRKDLVAQTDAAGFTTTYVYDPRHLLLSVTDAMGARRSFAYRSDGLRVEESVPGASTTRFFYDERGQTSHVEQVELGAVVSYRRDVAGRVTAVTDPLGNKTRREYTVRGRLSRVIYPDGNSVSYSYDAAGRIVSVTDEEGGVSLYCYDAVGRVTAVTDPVGNTRRLSYGAAGNLVQEIDPTGSSMSYEYDARGRLTRSTGPTGAVMQYKYDALGNLIELLGPEGGVIRWEYDDFNRLRRTTDPTGVLTSFSYDVRGNRISRSLGGGMWQTEYDERSRPVVDTDPYGNQTRYLYGFFGRPVEVTDALGGTTSYTYNAAGLPVLVQDPTGAVTEFSYDKAGRLTAESDPTGRVTSYTYDERGRMTAAANGAGEATRFAYDGAGRMVALIDPEGRAYRWEYDEAGRVSREIDQLGGASDSPTIRPDAHTSWRTSPERSCDTRMTARVGSRGSRRTPGKHEAFPTTAPAACYTPRTTSSLSRLPTTPPAVLSRVVTRPEPPHLSMTTPADEEPLQARRAEGLPTSMGRRASCFPLGTLQAAQPRWSTMRFSEKSLGCFRLACALRRSTTQRTG